MSNARIIEIPATRQIRSGKNNTMRKMRVAAYCRVSTEEEEQQGSFETQKLYYTEKINSTSEWELAGIYADDGISGIHTKKRDGFNQMMNIREEIFLMPDETPIDLLRILIWYDWEHEGVLQLATSRTANTPPGKTVSPIIYSEQLPLNRLLLDWADQKHSLSVRKITRADYLEWMLQWPPRLP